MANEYSKIDTQGMSGVPIGKGSNKILKKTNYPIDPVTGETIYPIFKPLTIPKMIDGMLREDLKELINEVLDEREMRRYSKDNSIPSHYDNL